MWIWGNAVKWLAIFGVVLVLFFGLKSCEGFDNPLEATRKFLRDVSGHIPISDPKRPLKRITDENEIRALAAICLVDSAGEKPAVRQEVCQRVMAAALRYHAKWGDSIDSIFRLAKTMYPRARDVPTGWMERSVSFVFRPTFLLGYRKAQRTEALHLAKQFVDRSVPSGCATHYTRAPRETTEVYDEKKGAQKLKESMYAVGEPNPVIQLRLYCPKEDAPK